jgi:hypothetical protein
MVHPTIPSLADLLKVISSPIDKSSKVQILSQLNKHSYKSDQGVAGCWVPGAPCLDSETWETSILDSSRVAANSLWRLHARRVSTASTEALSQYERAFVRLGPWGNIVCARLPSSSRGHGASEKGKSGVTGVLPNQTGGTMKEFAIAIVLAFAVIAGSFFGLAWLTVEWRTAKKLAEQEAGNHNPATH